MRDLRLRWLWLSLGWALLVLAVVASLAPVQPGPGLPIPDKLLHGLGYFGLMTWFGGIYRQVRYPVIAAGLFALGIGLEFAQEAFAERVFEIADMVANGMGILAGWFAAVAFLGHWCQWLEGRMFSGAAS